ncbi:MAG: HAD family phosphatase [Lachnospiraceae bacterium]|nr:HAD family phosphatase [Lachnospiraceae bacterium]
MIKNVIFDVGMVLVDFRWKALMKDLGFSDETAAILGKELVMSPLWNELDLGIQKEEEVIAKMRQNLPGFDRETQLFFDNLVDIVESYPYAKGWIHELKEAGRKVYLLSNYPKSLFEKHEKEKFDFLEEVDGKVVSGFVKMAKPDPAIYKKLLKTYGLNPEECVFLDDRKDNIRAAEALGIRGILFTDYETARGKLEELL